MKKLYFIFTLLLFAGKIFAAGPPPVITDFGNANDASPYFGTKRVSVCNGDLVTVQGANFDPSSNIVWVNNILVTLITQSSTFISFTLSSLSGTGSSYSGNIKIFNGSEDVISSNTISVEACPSYDIDTLSGIYSGNTVIISGNDLGSITDVSLENPILTSLSFSLVNDQISINIPSNTPSGSNRLILTQNTSPDITNYIITSYDFNIIAVPTITIGLVDASYQSEAAFNLDYTVSEPFNPGNEFNVEISNYEGSFTGNYIGTFSSQNSGSIPVILPIGDSGSGYRLKIHSTDPVTESDVSTNFEISSPPPPNITSFSPSSGMPLSFVTVIGENLQTIESAGIFGGSVGFDILSSSSTQLVLKLKSLYNNSTSITGSIALKVGESTYSSTEEFTVIPAPLPVIDSFSPISGVPGTEITIIGSNLEYATGVKIFSGTPVGITFNIISTDTLIATIDPKFMPFVSQSGKVKVLNSGDGFSYGQSSGSFTLNTFSNPTITGISPSTAYPGDNVTIEGLNFEVVNYVELPVGYSGTIISKTPNRIIASVDNETSFTQGLIKTGRSGYAQFDAFSSSEITILGFDGQITAIDINKTSFTTDEKIIFNITTTGLFSSFNIFEAEISYSGDFKDSETIGFTFNNSISGVGVLESIPLYIPFSTSSFPTFSNFKVRIKSTIPQAISGIISNIEIKRVPNVVFFSPFAGTPGTIVTLSGYIFKNSSISGVEFNGLSANYQIINDNQITAILPAGDANGIIKVLYGAGNYAVAPIPFGIGTVTGPSFQTISFDPIPNYTTADSLIKLSAVASSGLPVTYDIFTNPATGVVTLSGNELKILGNGVVTITAYQIGDSLFLPAQPVIYIFNITPPSTTFTEVVSLTISPADSASALIDSIGGSLQLNAIIFPTDASDKRVKWLVSDSLLASIDSKGLLKAKLNGLITVTAISLSNQTVTGTLEVLLINQYVAVTGMSILGEDSLNIVAYAIEDLPINALFIPDTATNQKYKLTILQSQSFVTERDTIEHIISLNKDLKDNGIVTIIGTSLDNPTVTGVWVITVIGKIIEESTPILQRTTPNATTSGIKQLNPCEGTLELFIDGSKYIGFQWFYAANNDTAIVVGANKPSFTPIIKGNYFIIAYDNEFNYEYQSFPLTISGPGKPLITASGILSSDTMLMSSVALDYQWFVDGKLIKGATEQTLRIWYNGSYSVSVGDDKKCKSISDPFNIDRPDFVDIARSGLQSTDSTIENYGRLKSAGNAKVYPNPAKDNFTIEYLSFSGRNLYVILFNSYGREVLNRKIEYVNNPLRTIQLDTKDFPRGLYNVQIIDGDNILYNKMLLE